MKKQQRPPQIENVIAKANECLESSQYAESSHFKQRKNERNIDLLDAIYVLKNGYHEKQKTSFNDLHGTWNYAIRYKVEGKDVRVIIAFEEDSMLFVTVMYVTNLDR